MRKKVILTVLALFMVFMLGACKDEKDQGSYQLFYLNIDGTKLETAYCDPAGGETTQIAENLLARLKQDPEQSDLRQTIPDNVNIESVVFTGYSLAVDFDQGLYTLEPASEVLLRAAVVKTLVQIKGVSYVNFTVEGEPYKDRNGNLVGSMNADSFVENTGDAINEETVTSLTLYFANKAGDKLVTERVQVTGSSNISAEKLVIESLIKGPAAKDRDYPTLPSGTKVLSISTKDGICYVNLNEGFLEQGYNVTEAVTIYSIVDSLTELSGISRVQILVNGETNLVYKESMRLDTIYERNLDIVEQE